MRGATLRIGRSQDGFHTRASVDYCDYIKLYQHNVRSGRQTDIVYLTFSQVEKLYKEMKKAQAK